MSIPIRSGPKSLQRTIDPQEMDKKLLEASKEHEKIFLSEMLKAMRGTVPDSAFMQKSQAEKIFQSQLDSEYIDKWSGNGGVGFAKIIYDSLKEKFGARLGLKQDFQKITGPIPIEQQKQFAPPKTSEVASGLQWTFEKNADSNQNPDKTPVGLQVPWNGELLGSYRLDSGLTVMDFAHKDGAKSQLIFKGLAKDLPRGQTLEQGTTVGTLSPEASSFFMNLRLPSGPDSVE